MEIHKYNNNFNVIIYFDRILNKAIFISIKKRPSVTPDLFLCYFDVIFIYFTINFLMLLPALTT